MNEKYNVIVVKLLPQSKAKVEDKARLLGVKTTVFVRQVLAEHCDLSDEEIYFAEWTRPEPHKENE